MINFIVMTVILLTFHLYVLDRIKGIREEGRQGRERGEEGEGEERREEGGKGRKGGEGRREEGGTLQSSGTLTYILSDLLHLQVNLQPFRRGGRGY